MLRTLFFVLGVAVTAANAAMAATPPIWKMPQQVNWQWQLTGKIDLTVNADVYDIDLFDTPASTVSAIHAKGAKAICYISFGTWEKWRPDAAQFPAVVLGKAWPDWPDERWLDIRRVDLIGPILAARLDLCKQKGFDGVEPDNVIGYQDDTGFPLTAQDQITFNKLIAEAAHARGLSVGLKNDLDQIKELQPYFDWALNEQCFQYKECTLLQPFIAAGKAVLNVEYSLDVSKFCPSANAMNFNSMKKKSSLNATRTPCRTVTATTTAKTIAGVANAASSQVQPVSPGSLISVYGNNLAKILVDGEEATIVFNNGSQAVVAVPFSVAGKDKVSIQTDDGSEKSDGFSVDVAQASPGVFTAGGTGSGQVAMLNQDGQPNTESQPAACGSIVSFFATGVGEITSARGEHGRQVAKPQLPVSVEIGGSDAEVVYAGDAPEAGPGVMQVNARVPCALPDSGNLSLVLRIGNFESQGNATMAVKKN